MSWLRLDAAYFSNPKIIDAGWDAAVVFLACLTMVKMHGWRAGAIGRSAMRPRILRRHLGLPERCHSDTDIENAIGELVRVGLLAEDENGYVVTGWSKYQPDPTATKRKRKSRSKNGQASQSRLSQGVTVSHGCHDDVRDVRTGRTDVRDRQEESPLPPPGGGLFASLSIWSAELRRDVVVSWATRRASRTGVHQDRAKGTLVALREGRLRVGRELDWIQRNDPDELRKVMRSIIRAQAINGAGIGQIGGAS